MRPLSTLFLEHLTPPRELGEAEATKLESALLEVLQAARRSWPAIELETEELLRHLAERIDDSPDLPRALAALHTSDLYLACACAREDRRALQELDRRYLSEIDRYVAKIDPSPTFADEVKQVLRKKLFVTDGESLPKILDYRGKGPLGGWLRVAAIRTARNLLRASKPFVPLDAESGIELCSPSPDPELSYAKDQYRREFQAAFEKTLASLSPRERNILGLYFLEGLSSSAIGELYGVTGAAVRVWLKRWRSAILLETRRLLGERLQVDGVELEQVVGLVESQFDLTISRLLRGTRP